jgi:hypothetical protein
MFSKNKVVRAIRLSDGKQRNFKTIEEAASTCKVTTTYVKKSMYDPLHISNRAHLWQPHTTRGKMRVSVKPEFRFEEVLEEQVVLIPMFEGEENVSLPSVYAAAKFLQVSRTTVYSRLLPNSPTNVLMDADGRQWMITANREINSEFGKQLKGE